MYFGFINLRLISLEKKDLKVSIDIQCLFLLQELTNCIRVHFWFLLKEKYNLFESCFWTPVLYKKSFLDVLYCEPHDVVKCVWENKFSLHRGLQFNGRKVSQYWQLLQHKHNKRIAARHDMMIFYIFHRLPQENMESRNHTKELQMWVKYSSH